MIFSLLFMKKIIFLNGEINEIENAFCGEGFNCTAQSQDKNKKEKKINKNLIYMPLLLFQENISL